MWTTRKKFNTTISLRTASFSHRQVHDAQGESLTLVASFKTDQRWFIWSVSEVDKAARFRNGLITMSIMFVEFGPKCEASPLFELYCSKEPHFGLNIWQNRFNINFLLPFHSILPLIFIHLCTDECSVFSLGLFHPCTEEKGRYQGQKTGMKVTFFSFTCEVFSCTSRENPWQSKSINSHNL